MPEIGADAGLGVEAAGTERQMAALMVHSGDEVGETCWDADCWVIPAADVGKVSDAAAVKQADVDASLDVVMLAAVDTAEEDVDGVNEQEQHGFAVPAVLDVETLGPDFY